MKLLRALPALLVLLSATTASAGGLFLTDRGVRPLGRGGAFIAGADDLHSMVYNPAGLSEAGTQLLVDAAYLQVDTSFLRRTYFANTSSGMPATVTAPAPVRGYNPFLPIPTLAFSHNFGLKTWNFGAILYVPYTPLVEYPATVVDPTTNLETAAPQRYSSISSQGTVLGILGLSVSKSFFDNKLAFGITPQVMMGVYGSQLALSSCPGVICAEQDPDYDAINQIRAGFIFAPSVALGARWSINEKWRLGFSGQLPFWVDTPAEIRVRLPNAAIFEGATVEGSQARMQFQTPLILRLGAEWRPIAGLRIELAAIFEGWSIHKNIAILRGQQNGVNLLNVNGFPSPYPIGDLLVTRNFRDTFSARLGAEYVGGTRALGFKLRAGFSYDRSAIPNEYLNVLTLDVDKFTPSIGASITFAGFSIDVVYAHVFGLPTTVDPAKARIYALSPVRGDPVERTAVNGGDYTLQSNVIGLGLTYQFN